MDAELTLKTKDVIEALSHTEDLRWRYERALYAIMDQAAIGVNINPLGKLDHPSVPLFDTIFALTNEALHG